MKLPNADHAIVDVRKLREYSLNPAHRKGQHKARVFAASLGFTTADAESLREMILSAVLTHDAMQGTTDEHGARYTVDFKVHGLRGTATVRTAWIIDAGETNPRLVSCYVTRE
jgi:hypothetical protein